MKSQFITNLFIVAQCCAFVVVPASAQQAGTVTQVNAGTVGIISGDLDSTSARVAAELAAVLDDGDNLRVLTVLGQGSVQSILDILYLKGIDIGIVQSDVLANAKQSGLHNRLTERIHYVAKLYNEELHLLVRSDIESLQQLAGKQVSFGPSNSGTYLTATTVFAGYGVDVVPVSIDPALALEKLKAGEIAGMVYVEGKPTRLFQSVSAQDGVHFLPFVFTPEILQTYSPSSLSNEDYPGLIPPGNHVATLAVNGVMAVYNWPSDTERYQKVSRFIDAFFSRFPEFQAEVRHRKWAEVSITAEVPGWTRFSPAEDWLERNTEPMTQGPVDSELKVDFYEFLTDQGLGESDAEMDRLFLDLVAWRKDSAAKTAALYRPTVDGIGERLGTIKFEDGPNGLIVTPDLFRMNPGSHGFHVHQYGECGPRERDGKRVPGLAAGGHLDLGGSGEHHGPLFNRAHLGDLPVLNVDGQGSATDIALAPGLKLTDVIGRAVVVHGVGADASRRACGIIG